MSRPAHLDGARSKDNPLSSARHSRSQIPNSPPLSSSASPPAVPSPQLSAYTPPTSAPMSAQPSQASYMTSPTVNTHTPSDSNRDAQQSSSSSSSSLLGKRKYEPDEMEATSNKRAREEEQSDPSEQESWTPYRLCDRPHPPSQPDGTSNLVELYSLGAISASVARTNDKGEKINKIRKSYEGFTKHFPGKNKAIARDRELLNFFDWPELEWQVQQVEGHDLMNGLSAQMMQNLEKSTQMQKVDLPPEENARWASLLEIGDYAPKQQPPQPAASVSTALPGKPATPAYSAASTPGDAGRPMLRRGTKRSYRDDSFVGYNESSFVDELDDDSIIDGDDDGRKRRKRKDTAGSPSYMNHYTPVSVGSGR